MINISPTRGARENIMINLLKKTIKKEEIKTMDELRYSYDWLALCSQYKKFDKVVKLAEDAYMSDCRIMDDERLCTICLLRGNKVFSKIFFKSAYGRDIIEDFKNQIENLHRETNGRLIEDIPYVSFTANPRYFYRLMNPECNDKPIYQKFDVDQYNELFNTYYLSVAEAVASDAEHNLYEEEIDSSFLD